MSKVCLIIPNSAFLLDERVFPFLGTLKVGAAWKEQGVSIDVVDLGGIENYLDVIKDYCESNTDLDFIGVTATTPQLPAAYKIAKFIKTNWPKQNTVLGGPHVTLMNTARLREYKRGVYGERAERNIAKLQEWYDVLACGDGELLYHEIKKAIETDVRIVDADNRKSPYFLSNESFSNLPDPDRGLIDLDSYHYYIEGERATSLISQLGCPFQCVFCSGRNSPFLRNIRTRSVQSIVDELEFLYLTYGYKAYMFYDDELNVNKEMINLMYSIAELGQKYGVEWKLRGFTKAELFTEEQAKAMYEAGFRVLLTGFESGDPRILTNIRKRATRDDNTKCVEIAKKHGLKVKALMSMGHAGESEETIRNTEKWLLEVQPDDFDCTVITTYPGSPYFDDAIYDGEKYVFTSKDTGDKLYQSNIDYTAEVDYYKGVPGEYQAHVWTDHLSTEELANLRDEVEENVRKKLNIPYNPANPAKKYEHSMGSSRNLPNWILRSTKEEKEKNKKIGLKVMK